MEYMKREKSRMETLADEAINEKPCVWRLVHSIAFEIIIIVLILLNIAELAVDEVFRNKDHDYCPMLVLMYLETMFTGIFLIEFILRVAADKR